MSSMTIAILLGLLGLFIGSFVGATVWRLRARQLRADETAGEKISHAESHEVSKLKKTSLLKDRSVCLHCGHQLEWYDLIPLISWLSLQGKCRYCRRPIGWTEPVVELSMAVFFAVSYLHWPTLLTTGFEVAHLAVWLATGTVLAILFIYDMRWFLLPNPIVFTAIGLGIVNVGVTLVDGHFALAQIMNIIYACVVLSGIYYLIYILSRHKWVGFGDVKLGLALALSLADWQLAILALFFANLIGTIIFLPLMVGGKVKRQAHVPFGPLLIGGWLIAGLFGAQIISWYVIQALGSA